MVPMAWRRTTSQDCLQIISWNLNRVSLDMLCSLVEKISEECDWDAILIHMPTDFAWVDLACFGGV